MPHQDRQALAPLRGRAPARPSTNSASEGGFYAGVNLASRRLEVRGAAYTRHHRSNGQVRSTPNLDRSLSGRMVSIPPQDSAPWDLPPRKETLKFTGPSAALDG